MAEGNGVDLGAIYQLLAIVAADTREMKRDKADKSDITSLRADFSSLRAEVGGVRQAVTQYHSSVLGHGILISELEARVRRVEDHLHLPPMIAAE